MLFAFTHLFCPASLFINSQRPSQPVLAKRPSGERSARLKALAIPVNRTSSPTPCQEPPPVRLRYPALRSPLPAICPGHRTGPLSALTDCRQTQQPATGCAPPRSVRPHSGRWSGPCADVNRTGPRAGTNRLAEELKEKIGGVKVPRQLPTAAEGGRPASSRGTKTAAVGAACPPNPPGEDRSDRLPPAPARRPPREQEQGRSNP